MGKTFYWVGGATGANALAAYDWNNPKNWIVQNSVIGGVASSNVGINQNSSTVSTTTSSNAVNRFNVSTGSIGAATDISTSYCPGAGDVVIIGEIPSLGNNTPKQVKAPLLFGGCGVTSGAGWTGNAGFASWLNAQTASATGSNMGIASLTIKNSFLPNTETPVYPFEWIGGGITSSNREILEWVESNNSSTDITALSNANTSDLRVIVKEQVTTNCSVPFETVTRKPVKVSLLFKAGVKQPQTVAAGASPMSVVKTKFMETSSHIALGIFGGMFDVVTIKEANNEPSSRFILFSQSYLNDVLVDRFGGTLWMAWDNYINKMNMTNTIWYGNMDSSLVQSFNIESSFNGPLVRSTLGYTGVLPSEHSMLKVGPCQFIHPTNASSVGTGRYSTAFPPTISLGTDIGLTLLGEEQKLPRLEIEGRDEDLISYLNGRWHLSFKGNINLNYLNAKQCVLKANPSAPTTSKVRIGTAEMSGNGEITFTKDSPIVDAGDQDIWYFGQMTDRLRGGLKFLDSTGLIFGSRGIVMANSFEDRDLKTDSRSGDIDYSPTETQGTVNF